MTELETMQRAKMYIDKLANGINPLDDSIIPENDIINNVRLSRCLFYVSDVLKQVIENGGFTPPAKIKRERFNITFDEIQKFPFSDEKLLISKITERINNLIDTDKMRRLATVHILNWLISIEALKLEKNSEGKNIKVPTERGRALGISTEERNGVIGNYMAVVYNRQAQQFIIDNIDAIISMMNNKRQPSSDDRP